MHKIRCAVAALALVSTLPLFAGEMKLGKAINAKSPTPQRGRGRGFSRMNADPI